MRKFFGINVFAVVTVLLAGPASAELWNIDFDTGLDANGNEITFAPDTIFSDRYSDTDWQRYDGAGTVAPNAQGEMPFRTNPSDGGIPGSNVPGDRVKVNINVWNARRDGYDDNPHDGYFTDYGQPGFAVGFDSTNLDSRDPDLEAPFVELSQNSSIHTSQTSGYNNVLIIQSHENYYTKKCGGGAKSDGNGICHHQEDGHSKADDEAKGGDIIFEFDREVTLLKMNIFDMEEAGGKVKFAGADGIFDEWIWIPTMPDNGVGLLTFNGDIGIKAHKMMVWLPGSGAIDNIMGDVETTSTVSEPGVLALFGVGLMAMGFYRRRRQEA